ncbi:D-alanine--D-alanine ligase [Pedobacter cryophilus]|uniref:D-alanine--D-alanine ligase n=1 Tax=Pedobacter cryophilus TaxID=2571271 RepID=A0A4U1C0X5_9SPHI|nr:D-alanine--D-alanine ligase [Pedobacter cryophilus]TKB97730.1 D-alanine--D-alanine ligase [Pedobacter cryophilus]
MKKNIALLAGGFTGESVVSLNSAQQIESQLDYNLFNVYKIIVTKEEWYYLIADDQKIIIDKNDFSITVDQQKITFDAVFIIIHGSPGEDGKFQGYFDLLNIPYTTCDATTSALTMNKGYTKAVVNGIKDLHVAKSLQLFTKIGSSELEISSQLKLPLFIKPNSGGSSIGMSKVNKLEDLKEALEKAFAEDDQILVEEFIKGREFTVGLYKTKNQVKVLPITEIISSKEFFDFEAKYTTGITEEITPAVLPQEITNKVGEIVTAAFYKLNCKGMVRVDFILEENTGNFYFIEINTVPGQSQNSIIPQQVRAAGMEVKDFYTLLIEEALA